MNILLIQCTEMGKTLITMYLSTTICKHFPEISNFCHVFILLKMPNKRKFNLVKISCFTVTVTFKCLLLPECLKGHVVMWLKESCDVTCDTEVNPSSDKMNAVAI